MKERGFSDADSLSKVCCIAFPEPAQQQQQQQQAFLFHVDWATGVEASG